MKTVLSLKSNRPLALFIPNTPALHAFYVSKRIPSRLKPGPGPLDPGICTCVASVQTTLFFVNYSSRRCAATNAPWHWRNIVEWLPLREWFESALPVIV